MARIAVSPTEVLVLAIPEATISEAAILEAGARAGAGIGAEARAVIS